MVHTLNVNTTIIVAVIALTLGIYGVLERTGTTPSKASALTLGELSSASRIAEVHQSVRTDVSQRLSLRRDANTETIQQSTQGESRDSALTRSSRSVPAAGAAVEQTAQGSRPSAMLLESFDGLGFGFEGPQGKANVRNPSDNTLAVGPDHIVQIVNSRMAVFTKKGKRFDATGKVLYGPVVTNAVFAGFGGQCEARNNGDAVVRYDQLARRWLIVMPIFSRGPVRPDQPAVPKSGSAAIPSTPGWPSQPGMPIKLVPPPVSNPANPNRAAPATQGQGPYSMCYAVSASEDPLGEYYRYEFLRPLFPDYPRPAVWPDGYYVPTSTGDEVIQKHACVVEREKMLKGLPATEQCIIIDGVNFLNNADLDGKEPPPRGAPNIVLAAGGTQLKKMLEDDQIFVWKFHVDWQNPGDTKVIGPEKIKVAPYHYLCGGQLTNCVPQPDTATRLDAQGDKIMARLVYRRIVNRELVAAVLSVNIVSGGVVVRWCAVRMMTECTL